MDQVRIAVPAARIAALCFLYRQVLGIPGVVDQLPRPRVPKKLPDVLDREEVHQLLGMVTLALPH
jgi:site-specific recombinase XerD